MSADLDLIRRATSGLRDEWGDSDGSPRPMGTAWHRERDFHLAVADWLDWLAPFARHGDDNAFVVKHGISVARAFLGEVDA